MTGLEAAANGVNAVSIALAGRNSVHTWWIGIVGCGLFAAMFFHQRLYADVTLQVFFIGTSVAGWIHWRKPGGAPPLAVRRCRLKALGWLMLAGVAVTLGYGWLLKRFTNAYAPFIDSIIMAFSMLGQFLLMGRRLENWWCWLLVNTVAVPLYAYRELYITAALYAGFWLNAWISLRHWRTLVIEET